MEFTTRPVIPPLESGRAAGCTHGRNLAIAGPCPSCKPWRSTPMSNESRSAGIGQNQHAERCDGTIVVFQARYEADLDHNLQINSDRATGKWTAKRRTAARLDNAASTCTCNFVELRHLLPWPWAQQGRKGGPYICTCCCMLDTVTSIAITDTSAVLVSYCS